MKHGEFTSRWFAHCHIRCVFRDGRLHARHKSPHVLSQCLPLLCICALPFRRRCVFFSLICLHASIVVLLLSLSTLLQLISFLSFWLVFLRWLFIIRSPEAQTSKVIFFILLGGHSLDRHVSAVLHAK